MSGTAHSSVDGRLSALKMGIRELLINGERFRHALGQELQLGPNDLLALDYLYGDGPLTPRQLADKLGMTSGTLTALLDRVEKAGFLSRRNNPNDRRSLLLAVTPAGQHAMEWLYGQLDGILHEAFDDLPAEEVERLAHTLLSLGRALGQQAQS